MNRVMWCVLMAANCAADLPADPDCRRTDDCDAAICVSGRCEFAFGPDAGPPRPDLDGGFLPGPSDGPKPPSGPCANAAAPTAETLVLNELLANVPPGAAGDANGDGLRDPYDDEFVELVNTSTAPLNLAGVRIVSGGKLKHTFEPVCLLPAASIVVFGGGSVGLSVPGNALISDTRFAFANDGGVVEITAPAGLIARLDYDRAAAASLTRVPQLRGPQWVNHLQLSTDAFSPGACPDGTPLPLGCPAAAGGSADAGGD